MTHLTPEELNEIGRQLVVAGLRLCEPDPEPAPEPEPEPGPEPGPEPVPAPDPHPPDDSRTRPLFGVDVHPEFQRNFDFLAAKRMGYTFAFIKTSEGPYRDGTDYIPSNLDQFVKRAEDAGLIVGNYHYLVETAAEPQAHVFMDAVGNPDGRLLIVDFEPYANYPSLTPGNQTLRDFVAEVKDLAPEHPVVIYSGKGFWQGGDPSGPIQDYHTKKAWDAYWPRGDDELPRPREAYQEMRTQGWGKRWGGVEPVAWQFTPAGMVGGMNVDVDAFRGGKPQLVALSKGALVKPEDPKEWDPVTGPLKPPGFKPLAPRPGATNNYELRHPTRYKWRPDVENIVRTLYGKFGKRITVSTYHKHPGPEIVENDIYCCRDTTSFDVWGQAGRDDPIGKELGDQVFEFLYQMESEPDIDWIVWWERMYSKDNGYTAEPFGVGNWFMGHKDHVHYTGEGPSQVIA